MIYKKFINSLILGFGIIFFIGYFILTLSNEYYGDDLHFIYIIRTYGIIDVSINMFKHFECPITIPFNLLLLYISSKLGGISILNSFIFATNIGSLYILLRTLCKKNISQFQILLFSIFIISASYSMTRSVGGLSSIFWGIGQLAYILPLTYLFLWLRFFLLYKQTSHEQYLHVLGVLSVILLNTRLNYCIFFLLYAFAYYIYSFYFCGIDFHNDKRLRNFVSFMVNQFKTSKFRIVFIYSVLGLLFYILNPGNFERLKFDGQTSISLNLFDYIRAVIIGQKHFYLMIFTSIRFLAVLILVSILVTVNFNFKHERILNGRFLIFHFFVFTASLMMQTLLMKIIFGTPIYQGRIYFLSEFLFLVFFAHFIYFMSHHYSYVKNNILKISSIVIVIMLLSAQIFYLFRQIHYAFEFKIEYERRISLIISEKTKMRVAPLLLEKLPESGVLGIAEISKAESMKDDKVYYENKRIENFYDLPFKIYMK